ncbi:hypothetical protein [Streptomyces erythrochromogenes]|uniref:hypothetical protein n=1 Tax=Streptomyces erythrochromogenes TaxID=285574 RepID=UPI0037D69D7E
MTATRTRRLPPVLIAATLAVGGVSLATTAHAAPSTAPAVTADDQSGIKRIGKAKTKSIKRIGRPTNPGTAMQDGKTRADSYAVPGSLAAGSGGSGGNGAQRGAEAAAAVAEFMGAP